MKRKIRVNDYYGVPAFYSVMPEQIFDALELAALHGERHVAVDGTAFDRMIVDFNEKMKKCGRQ